MVYTNTKNISISHYDHKHGPLLCHCVSKSRFTQNDSTNTKMITITRMPFINDVLLNIYERFVPLLELLLNLRLIVIN